MTWTCYWIEDTGTAALGLRRYSDITHDRNSPGWCPLVEHTTGDSPWSYHSTLAWLGERQTREIVTESDGHRHYAGAHDMFEVADDEPRWPASCACGYVFTDDDNRQQWAEEIFVRADTGAEVSTHPLDVPDGCEQVQPGAMQDAWWYARFEGSDGPLGLNPARPQDGITLLVHCPRMDGNGTQPWCVDQAATGGGFWTRTGDPRKPETLEVSPSIAIGLSSAPGYYHGFLRAGVLTDHIG